ncbi:galactokinase [Segetibacter sp. 3557_3]|uniref:galactokinase n=1 Tax=Segetibacter sp. 3557_3 TaxID=2547429 RepID=UPI001058E338|nr:galactokinase [Segetibacter sp. 3557_3]TDH23049.1 galactokinase [Segetibacter sp. 3557_3]
MSTSSNLVVEKFYEQYKSAARLFYSPGRINLIGEHIDYNAGFVLPAAIDKGIWYAVAPNGTNSARFYSVDLDEHLEISLDNIHPIDGWQNYVLGVIDQAQQRGLIIKGFDCAFGGNIPIGSGLSSSAAVECGLLTALNEVFSLGLDRKTIALMGQKAEHTFPKVMCGIMDQYANMMGKMNHVILLDCLTIEHRYLPLSLEEYSIILINTKVHHSLASGEYNVRRQQCEQGLKTLQSFYPDAKTFRDITPEQVQEHESDLGGDIFKRCLYVTQEIARTQKAALLCEANNLEGLGKLMYETHEGLSKLYDVSCPELDFLVEQARKYPEIIGSRVMGGGFGGCTINLIRKEHWNTIVETITTEYKSTFDIDAEVYEVATSDGTYEAIGG